jgi:maleylpyruvate isomerase
VKPARDVEHLIAPPIDTTAAREGCKAAHARLLATIDGLDDATAAGPGRLPGWSVGHVLTHLARQADGHIRMLDAAADGKVADQYAGGPEGRAAEIDAGAGRPAAELVADVAATIDRLEAAWDRTAAAVWAHGFGRGTFGDLQPCADLPFRRWREVEVHHADLGLDFDPSGWTATFVDTELPRSLAALPARLPLEDRRLLLAWLLGRSVAPPELPPW